MIWYILSAPFFFLGSIMWFALFSAWLYAMCEMDKRIDAKLISGTAVIFVIGAALFWLGHVLVRNV